jgi:hypothetical protein
MSVRRRRFTGAAAAFAVLSLTACSTADDLDATTKPPKVRGEPTTATVERRLLRDPDVLWVGTWDSPNWIERHGATAFEQPQHVEVRPVPGSSTGNALWARVPARSQKGFGYQAMFDASGIRPRDDVFFRYRVYFPRDYAWRNRRGGGGGKLPGLAGRVGGDPRHVGAGGRRWKGRAVVGRDHLDDQDGFSARLLWHPDGGLSSYIYAVRPVGERSRSSYFGYSARCTERERDSNAPRLRVTRGGWNTIEMHVRMNEPGRADGVFELWLNGRRCLLLDRVEWRSRRWPDLRITQQDVEWFYGGSSRDYPDRESKIAFDDAVLSRSYIGPRRGPSGAGAR